MDKGYCCILVSDRKYGFIAAAIGEETQKQVKEAVIYRHLFRIYG